jgi:hypothetical protein
MTRFGSGFAFAALLGLASPAACAGVKLPGGETIAKVNFERHVMGVFGRMGCNSGSCHGSFQGKGGFRLSLFGYDPEKDYLALSRDGEGRRLNPADPDSSLQELHEHAAHQRPGRGGERAGQVIPSEQGPQISQEQMDKILGYVDLGRKQGANLLTGGRRVGETCGGMDSKSGAGSR